MHRLLQIDSCIGIGSTGRIAENIARQAIKEGWDCYMAHGSRYIGKSIQNSIQIGSKRDEYVHCLNSSFFDNHGLSSKQATITFIRKIKEVKPDVILLHNIHGYYLNYQILFEYLSRITTPIIWVQHDCWAFTGHCVHFTAVNCSKWKTQCNNCPRLNSYPRSYLCDRSYQNYTDKKEKFTSVENMTIVCVSEWLANVVGESFLGKYPTKVIQNGIDVKTFTIRVESQEYIRKKYQLNDKCIVLGVATGWSQDNGFYDFIELRKKLPNNYEIVLVGVTEEQQKNLPLGVTGILRTDSIIELSEIYSAADIFVNGSFEETFGLVTAEAISCGTPAIVYDSTACPSIISSETGFVILTKDLDRMAQVIISYIETGDKKSYAENCRKYAIKHFDQEIQTKEYLNLINDLLK